MKAKILIVGEAYGVREELFSHPFVGASGQELARMLHQAELAPDLPHKFPTELEMIKYWKALESSGEIIVTNVFNRRPKDNDVMEFFSSTGDRNLPAYERGKYVLHDLRPEVENLWALAEATRPNLILALGNTACWATLGETKITALRGTLKFSPKLNIKVLPTFHPASVLRQWNQRTIVISDFTKAKSESEMSTVSRVKRWLTVNPTLPEIEEWISRPADLLAVDIENPKIKVGAKTLYLRGQIAMIGFARSATDAIVIPFFDPDRLGGHFWTNPGDEFRAWKLAEKLLSSPVPKVFQNGVFDLTHLLRVGFRPKYCFHDTMLLHHALYPEMLKSLGFLASIYSGEIAWKQMSGKGNNLKRDE